MGTYEDWRKERDADRRAQDLADAIDASVEADDDRHLEILEQQRQLKKEQRKNRRQAREQFEFSLWWDTLTKAEKRKYLEDEKVKKEAEQKRLQEEAQQRKKALEESSQRVQSQLRDLNAIGWFGGIFAVPTSTIVDDVITEITGHSDPNVRLVRYRAFSVASGVLISLITTCFLVLNRATYIPNKELRTGTLDFWVTVLVLFCPFIVSFAAYVPLSDLFQWSLLWSRVRRYQGFDRAKYLFLLVNYRSKRRWFRSALFLALGLLVVVEPVVGITVDLPISRSIGEQKYVYHQTLMDRRSKLDEARKTGQEWLSQGEVIYNDASVITDRTEARAALRIALNQLEPSLKAVSTVKINALTYQVYLGTLQVGTVYEWQDRVAAGKSN